MSGPKMYLGLWDPRRDTWALYEAVAAHLTSDGARLDEETVAVYDHEHFSPDGESGDLDDLTPNNGEGGLVQLVWSVASLHDAENEAWRLLRASIGAVVLAVRPALVTISIEWSADDLPEPDWEAAVELFTEGWVDPAALSPDRRARFERLAERGLAHPYGPGLWWGTDADISPNGKAAAIPPTQPGERWEDIVLAAAVYEAWTGRPAPPPGYVQVPEIRPPDDTC